MTGSAGSNRLQRLSCRVSANTLEDGIYLPPDDRRHYVAWSPVKEGSLSAVYFKELYAWFENGGKQNVAAHLAKLDLSGFEAKAPPPKTAAFWKIAGANQPAEDSELADVLDALGKERNLPKPNVVTLPMIVARAPSREMADWFSDRRNARHIPRKMRKCGYEVVRNPGDQTGRWRIGGGRMVVYGLIDLSEADRLAEVRQLIDR